MDSDAAASPDASTKEIGEEISPVRSKIATLANRSSFASFFLKNKMNAAKMKNDPNAASKNDPSMNFEFKVNEQKIDPSDEIFRQKFVENSGKEDPYSESQIKPEDPVIPVSYSVIEPPVERSVVNPPIEIVEDVTIISTTRNTRNNRNTRKRSSEVIVISDTEPVTIIDSDIEIILPRRNQRKPPTRTPKPLTVDTECISISSDDGDRCKISDLRRSCRISGTTPSVPISIPLSDYSNMKKLDFTMPISSPIKQVPQIALSAVVTVPEVVSPVVSVTTPSPAPVPASLPLPLSASPPVPAVSTPLPVTVTKSVPVVTAVPVTSQLPSPVSVAVTSAPKPITVQTHNNTTLFDSSNNDSIPRSEVQQTIFAAAGTAKRAAPTRKRASKTSTAPVNSALVETDTLRIQNELKASLAAIVSLHVNSAAKTQTNPSDPAFIGNVIENLFPPEAAPIIRAKIAAIQASTNKSPASVPVVSTTSPPVVAPQVPVNNTAVPTSTPALVMSNTSVLTSTTSVSSGSASSNQASSSLPPAPVPRVSANPTPAPVPRVSADLSSAPINQAPAKSFPAPVSQAPVNSAVPVNQVPVNYANPFKSVPVNATSYQVPVTKSPPFSQAHINTATNPNQVSSKPVVSSSQVQSKPVTSSNQVPSSSTATPSQVPSMPALPSTSGAQLNVSQVPSNTDLSSNQVSSKHAVPPVPAEPAKPAATVSQAPARPAYVPVFRNLKLNTSPVKPKNASNYIPRNFDSLDPSLREELMARLSQRENSSSLDNGSAAETSSITDTNTADKFVIFNLVQRLIPGTFDATKSATGKLLPSPTCTVIYKTTETFGALKRKLAESLRVSPFDLVLTLDSGKSEIFDTTRPSTLNIAGKTIEEYDRLNVNIRPKEPAKKPSKKQNTPNNQLFNPSMDTALPPAPSYISSGKYLTNCTLQPSGPISINPRLSTQPSTQSVMQSATHELNMSYQQTTEIPPSLMHRLYLYTKSSFNLYKSLQQTKKKQIYDSLTFLQTADEEMSKLSQDPVNTTDQEMLDFSMSQSQATASLITVNIKTAGSRNQSHPIKISPSATIALLLQAFVTEYKINGTKVVFDGDVLKSSETIGNILEDDDMVEIK